MGAACFSGEDAGSDSKFNLVHVPSSGTCTNDVCCNGLDACEYSFLTGVNTLSCRGQQACKDLQAELQGNLYCNAATDGGACSNNLAAFTFSGDTNHCVECYGKDTCKDSSQFIFDGKEKVKMTCGMDGADSSGTCGQAQIHLRQDTCLHLVCKTGTCAALSVINYTAGSTCFCEGRGKRGVC